MRGPASCLLGADAVGLTALGSCGAGTAATVRLAGCAYAACGALAGAVLVFPGCVSPGTTDGLTAAATLADVEPPGACVPGLAAPDAADGRDGL